MWPFSAFFHPDIAIALLWSFLLWSVRGFDKTVKTLVLFVDLRRTALLFIFLHFTIISITHKGFIDFTGVVALLHKTSKICLFLPVCPAMHSSRLGLATVRKQRLPKLCWRWTMVFECIVLFCTAYDTCIYTLDIWSYVYYRYTVSMCDSMLWTVCCLQECPEILAIQLAGSSQIEERMMLLLKAGAGAETSRGPLGCWNKLLHRDGTPRISQVSASLSYSGTIGS